MRIVFMGTAGFGLPALRRLLDGGHDVPVVVTGPDKPAGRGRKVHQSDIKLYAAAAGIPVLQPASLKDPAFAGALAEARAELFAVVAFRILPPAVFTLPQLGSINLHASLLPKYRGAAPVNWAIIRGEKETGVTTFLLEEGVDTGRILVQERTPIGPEETAGELHDRLAEIGAGALLETVRLIGAGRAEPKPQDASLATPAPKIFRDDCRIDWTLPAASVHDFIRGMSPRPGAFFMRWDTVVKVYRSSIFGSTDLAGGSRGTPPGTVIESEKELVVSCGEGAVRLEEIHQEGKSTMSAAEFLRGARMNNGETFK
jgi:methionyl-tRNA formyltransferase